MASEGYTPADTYDLGVAPHVRFYVRSQFGGGAWTPMSAAAYSEALETMHDPLRSKLCEGLSIAEVREDE